MCCRFSVDFAAHISYHYLDSPGSPDDRVKKSLYGLGLPIVQGAVSTILGVIGLMIAPSYIFITFFKMVFLVILLGALHGLFLLPVLLSLFGPGSCSKEEKQKLKSPATSYMSDGDSLEGKGGKMKGLEGYGEEGLRIPRPVTTISLGTATPTDMETSGSSPGSEQLRTSGSSPASEQHRPAQHEKQKRSRRARQKHHEMYHNNGYMSEEEDPGPRIYYTNYPGYFPQYAFPVDTQHSSVDKRCRSKSKDCRKKRQKH